MKKLFTLLLLVIGSFAIAQQNYQDVVYLKNGSIIRGIIIEQVPNVSLKIETADKSVMAFKMEEVEKLAKEPMANTNPQANTNPKAGSSSGIIPGFCGIINVGYGFGLGDSNKGLNAVNLDFINGFQIFPYFSIGIGTGVKVLFYKDYSTKPILIPAFVNLRGHFLKGFVSPFLGMDIGYCWEVSPDTQGLGLLFNPSLGVSLKTGKKSRINFATGYSMQKIKDSDHTISTWNFIFGISY